MRVLLYSRVNPADGGGVQAVIVRLAAHLRRRGHTVVTAWGYPGADRPREDARYELPRLVTRHGVPAPRSALHVGRAGARLALALARHRPDIVNLHFLTSEGVYFLRLRRMFGYRLVVSAHGSDVLRPKPWNAPSLPRILCGADAITAVSSATAACILANRGVDPRRVHVIPNGVDLEFWSGANDAGRAGRRPTVITVGRLHPVKGQDVLLRAFPRVLANFPDTHLVLIGDGPMRRELEALTRALGLESAVEFAGRLGPEEIRARMAMASAFALPSRSEGLPLALLEAMAARLPVVATAVGGVPEVVLPGTGTLVTPGDPGALAVALLGVLSDPGSAVRFGRAAEARARAFSAEATAAAYELLLANASGAATT